MVGFVFFPPSPRHVTFAAARTMGTRVRGRAGKVALTDDADDALLTELVEALEPDVLQLHVRESPDRVASLKKRFGLPVMKAIAVAAVAELASVEAYAQVADRLLFDARSPREATRQGCLGNAFDWHLLQDMRTGVPVMGSGGLDAANAAEALRITHAPGVDVSSGVERTPGDKDPEKIRAFVRAARAAAARLDTQPLTSIA